MTPQRHPPDSVCALDGYACVWYDDGTRQAIALEEFETVRHGAEAAKRATRMLLPESQAATVPLSIVVRGLYGDRHAVDLLRVTQVSAWPATAVRAEDADAGTYPSDDDESEAWRRGRR